MRQIGWVLSYLADIASDLSVFHGIHDAGEMEADVFFALAVRLPAYTGAMAARVAAEQGSTAPQASHGDTGYGSGSQQANNAATALSAPPLTAAALMELNARAGSMMVTHAAVPGA